MQSENISVSWLDRPVFSGFPQLKRETLLAVLILLLTILTRFAFLGERVMSHDEINHVVPAYDLFMGKGYRYDPVTHGPFQFHAIAFCYFLLGDSDFSARVPAAFMGVLTVAMALFGFRRYLGRSGALIAGLLMLISPYMMFYGRYTRNEGYIVLFVIVMLYAVLRYFEKGDKLSIFLLTGSLAFQFADKATSYIFSAQLLIFLGFLFLDEVRKADFKDARNRSLFFLMVLAAMILFGGALGMGVINASTGTATATGTQSPVAPGVEATPATTSMPISVGETSMAILGIALGVAAIALLIFDLGWSKLRAMKTFNLIVLIGSLILPLLAAFPVKMMGWDPLDYSTTGLQRTGIFVVILTALGIALGLWWNSRLWLQNAALFYAIFTVFYTTFFTNGQGFFMGLIAGLGYWLAQQSVERGSQPLYYYALIQIPIYEYLVALGTLLAISIGLWRNKFFTFPCFSQVNDAPALAENAAPASDEVEEAGILTHAAPQRIPTLALLAYWSLFTLVAFSLAGERMPWLTIHIALPMALCAGWGLGYLVDVTPWKKLFNRQGIIALLLLPVFLASSAGMLGSLLGTTPPFQGNTLEQLQSTSLFIVSTVATLLSAAGFIGALLQWEPLDIFRLVGVALFSLFAVLTARSAYMASFINYDSAKEYLVYAHAARGPKDILAQIEEISRRTTKGKDLVISYDGDGLYPFWWYLRDYPNHKWFSNNPSRELRDSPVIIAGEENYSKLEPIVGKNYVYYEYNRLWWPNQDYFGLNWDRFKFAVSNPEMRSAIFDIWLNRDYTRYAKITNSTTLTPETWQPGARERLYIRKDIISQIWNYGTSGLTLEAPAADPYQGKMQVVEAVQIIGDTGVEPGKFQRPRGVAIAPDGSIYVADSQNHRIQHFSAKGEVLHVWGSFADSSKGEAPGGTFNEPWGLAIGPDGSVYVTDTWNHRIQKFSADGKFMTAWGQFGQAEQPDFFWGPRGLAFDPQGRLYVTDTGNKRVAIFDANGKFITQFGTAGLEIGQFDEPVGIAIDSTGKVFVADTWNQRIQTFVPDASGVNFVSAGSWEVSAWFGQSLDNKPFLATDAAGNVFVTDPESKRVLKFKGSGEFVLGWGDTANGEAAFGMAAAAAADRSGGIWVSDAVFNRILRFVLPE